MWFTLLYGIQGIGLASRIGTRSGGSGGEMRRAEPGFGGAVTQGVGECVWGGRGGNALKVRRHRRRRRGQGGPVG